MGWPGTAQPMEELVEGHYSALYRYAYRLSGRAQEAEDLTQEVFCQAQLKWSQLRDAQRAVARQERWRAPYYWAGFVLQGEWR